MNILLQGCQSLYRKITKTAKLGNSISNAKIKKYLKIIDGTFTVKSNETIENDLIETFRFLNLDKEKISKKNKILIEKTHARVGAKNFLDKIS